MDAHQCFDGVDGVVLGTWISRSCPVSGLSCLSKKVEVRSVKAKYREKRFSRGVLQGISLDQGGVLSFPVAPGACSWLFHYFK